MVLMLGLFPTQETKENDNFRKKIVVFFGSRVRNRCTQSYSSSFHKKIVVTANREHLFIIRSVVYLYRLI